MAKKLILQRNLRKSGGSGPPYLKYLVISAVCLTVLVILVPYLIKGKSKEVTKRPVPERGTITKELPKQPEQSTPDRLQELAKPAEPVRPPETKLPEPATAPEAVKPPEVQPAPKPPEPGTTANQKSPTAEAPPEGKAPAPEKASPAQSAKSSEPAPRDLFPKKSAPSEAPATAALKKGPAKPEAKTAGKTPQEKPASPAKPAPSTEKGDHAVQVGAIFKDRQQAEKVRKDLEAKGYKAVVHTAAGGGGYYVTTSACPASKAYTLQEQMRIQGLSDTKVIKVATTPGPAPKPAPKGRPTPSD